MNQEKRKEYLDMRYNGLAESWDWEVVGFKTGAVMRNQLVMPVIRRKSRPEAEWFFPNNLEVDVRKDLTDTYIDRVPEKSVIGSGLTMLDTPIPYNPTALYIDPREEETKRLLVVPVGAQNDILDAYLAID